MFGTYNDKNEIVYSDDDCDSMRTTAEESSSEGANWENFVLRFGKYKGTTLGKMIQQGRTRQYLRYILKWPDIRPHTAQNINQALAHYEELKQARGDLPLVPPPLTREYSRAV